MVRYKFHQKLIKIVSRKFLGNVDFEFLLSEYDDSEHFRNNGLVKHVFGVVSIKTFRLEHLTFIFGPKRGFTMVFSDVECVEGHVHFVKG